MISETIKSLQMSYKKGKIDKEIEDISNAIRQHIKNNTAEYIVVDNILYQDTIKYFTENGYRVELGYGNWYIWWSDENKECLDNIKTTLNTIEADLDNKDIDIDILKIVRGKLAKIYLLLNKEKP